MTLPQRLFTSDANVRNVKSFFSIKRSKFGARVPLPGALKIYIKMASSPYP
ncbi:hypothetical protein HUU62_06345 [Rhodoferax sp. 4810]|nr:hypothetical protein [Rhodoferax jenense]